MDESTQGGAAGDTPDDALARLIERSGRRAQAPADMEQRVRAAVESQWREQGRRRRQRRVGTLALAATVVAALGMVLVWNTGNRAAEVDRPLVAAAATVESVAGRAWLDDTLVADGARIPAGARVRTAADGRLALRMGGGAALRLDQGSNVQVLGVSRVELLAGGLYVDSQLHDGFVVQVHNLEVRDVGTQFDVRLDPILEVGLREGAVTVTEADSGRLRAELVAMDGSGVVVQLDNGDRVRRVTSVDSRWKWAEEAAPRMDIHGVSSARYLAWVARETGRELQFASEEAARRAMSAQLGGRFQSVELRDTIGEVLEMADLVEVKGQPGQLIVNVAP